MNATAPALSRMIAAGLLALLGLAASPGPARADDLAEYRLKAAFLFNFVTFTEWPAEVGNSLTLCVYGPDPFGEDLDRLRGKRVGGRELAVRRVNSVDGLGACQAIFITRPVIGNLSRVLDGVNGRPVLTMADSPGAMRQGVALNMATEQNKVTFEASLAAARSQGLGLSSKLLRLATEVRQ